MGRRCRNNLPHPQPLSPLPCSLPREGSVCCVCLIPPLREGIVVEAERGEGGEAKNVFPPATSSHFTFLGSALTGDLKGVAQTHVPCAQPFFQRPCLYSIANGCASSAVSAINLKTAISWRISGSGLPSPFSRRHFLAKCARCRSSSIGGVSMPRKSVSAK